MDHSIIWRRTNGILWRNTYGTPEEASKDPKMLAKAEAKQRNRAMRNDVDTRSALTGITWKEGEQMWT